MYVDKTHETRDADLGYIEIYSEALHQFIISGALLPERTNLLIKEAHEHMQAAFASISDIF